MVNKNPRISKSGVTTTGRFPLFSNSPEVKDAEYVESTFAKVALGVDGEVPLFALFPVAEQ